MNLKRRRIIKEGPDVGGPVVYWMSREQRVRDNWPLLYAQQCAIERRVPVAVVFCLVPTFLGATIRQYNFMLRGLEEVDRGLRQCGIAFYLVKGSPARGIAQFVKSCGASLLVTDFDPLRIKREWKAEVAKEAPIPVHEVDGRNIVPCWVASAKQEYGAYTLRPKVHRALPEFLDEIPRLRMHPFPWKQALPVVDWLRAGKSVKADRAVPEVDWIIPGEQEARRALESFIEDRLSSYAEARNDPTRQGQSNLSPYLHFGHLSAQRVALEVIDRHQHRTSRDAFLEELIVRRELSDNFCFYNIGYDTFEGFPDWARRTLDLHRRDRREHLYTVEEFEGGNTHDDLWNAAQTEMVRRGTMHGYLRMYWAKKILEWTSSPEEALNVAIYLNDRYELDGRDSNGYAGIAWSIGGVHDRAWPERPVFGKIRYMSYGGCRSKFDVKAYIERVSNLER
jgi:deoxyribodipyrimidine photo-lyase